MGPHAAARPQRRYTPPLTAVTGVRNVVGMNRSDLPQDATAAYATLTAALHAHRESARAHEARLLALRAQIHREISAGGRGGLTRLARAAAVTPTQAGRLLLDDLVRAAHAALEAAGFARDDYRLRTAGQANPASAWLRLPADDSDAEDDARTNHAGGILAALHRAGLNADADGPGPALARGGEIRITWG